MLGIVTHGSLVLIGPDAADHLAFAGWLAEHVGPEALFWGDALVVEPRYVDTIVAGLQEDGFEIEGGA